MRGMARHPDDRFASAAALAAALRDIRLGPAADQPLPPAQPSETDSGEPPTAILRGAADPPEPPPAVPNLTVRIEETTAPTQARESKLITGIVLALVLLLFLGGLAVLELRPAPETVRPTSTGATLLRLESEPTGATVRDDAGRTMGRTPLELEAAVAAGGIAKYVVSAPGYSSAPVELPLDGGRHAQRVRLDPLRP